MLRSSKPWAWTQISTFSRSTDGLAELFVSGQIELGRRCAEGPRKTKTRDTKAEKKAAEEVLDEIVPDGPDRFPDDFFRQRLSVERNWRWISQKQRSDSRCTPLFSRLYTADGSYKRDVKNSAEGKFLLYAQRGGHRTAKVPAQIVEITRTVANYEKYLRDLRKHLMRPIIAGRLTPVPQHDLPKQLLTVSICQRSKVNGYGCSFIISRSSWRACDRPPQEGTSHCDRREPRLRYNDLCDRLSLQARR